MTRLTRRTLVHTTGAFGVAAMSAGLATATHAQDGEPLRVLMQTHPATDALRALAPQWSEESGVEVVIEDLAPEQLLDKLRLNLAAGSDAYDVIGLFMDVVAQYEAAGWLTPLNEVMPEVVEDKDFVGPFVAGLTHGGSVVGVPFYGESTSLTYNKAMFEEAGLTEPPRTFEELREYAETLTDVDERQYGITLRGLKSGQNLLYIWAGFFHGFGGEFFDEDMKPTFASEEGARSVEFYADLVNNYAPPGTGSASWDVVQSHMQQGLAAMNIDATNFAVQFEDPEKSLVAGQIGYTTLPEGPDGAAPSIFTYGLAIPAGSDRKDAAADFITWATSSEFQLASVEEETRGDVTRASVWNAMENMPKYGFDDGAWTQSTLASMGAGDPDYRPRIPEWPAIADIISIAVSSVIAGEAEAMEALEAAEAEVEELMANAGYYD